MKKQDPRIVMPSDDEVKVSAGAEGGAAPHGTGGEDAAAQDEGRQDSGGQDTGETTAPADDPVAALCREVESYKDKYLRAEAETVNVSRRLQQQHAQAIKHAAMDLARELLPIVDSLERTLEHVSRLPADDPVGAGVKLIADELAKVLKAHGIEPIEAVGRPFDPEVHEALMQDATSTLPAGTVCAELQKGYRLHERVLRPSRVAISSGGADVPAGDGKKNETSN
jgi:molecular chaperone GrpE